MNDSSTAIALDLAQPWMLWGLIALVPIVWYFVRSLSEFALWQRRASLLIRSLIIVCLVLSLAGITQLAPTQRRCIVMAIDRSQSIDAEAAESIDRTVNDLLEASRTASANRDGEIELRTMDFASESAATKVISAGAQSESERSALTDEQRLDSNLAKALESAVAAIPPGMFDKLCC